MFGVAVYHLWLMVWGFCLNINIHEYPSVEFEISKDII